MTYWKGLNDVKGIDPKCPHCFHLFDSFLSTDGKIATTFEKNLTDITGAKSEKTVRRLLEQEQLDEALVILRSIPPQSIPVGAPCGCAKPAPGLVR